MHSIYVVFDVGSSISSLIQQVSVQEVLYNQKAVAAMAQCGGVSHLPQLGDWHLREK